tara:strand:+ start:235 stop:618 length:384 start_codon:yes stop_codon:yes gene_type:complete
MPKNINSMVFTSCEVIRVVDGDTVDVEFDLGFDVFTRQRLRLARINAPEVKGAKKIQGLESKNAVAEWVAESVGTGLTVTTTERDKYGRYIAEIELIEKNEKWSDGLKALNLSDWLVKNGYAVYQEY